MLKGLICPILMPIKKKGQLDEVNFKKIWDYVTPWVAGISIGSSFSQKDLDFTEKKDAFRLVSDIWDKNMPILLDITCKDEAETFSLAEFVTYLFPKRDSVFLELLPLLYRGNRGLPHHLERIYQLTGMPLVLVNHPKKVSKQKGLFKHKNIRTAIFKRICQKDYIYAMIFQGNLKRFFNYQRALGGREFLFYEGNEATFLKQPTTGGVVAITANLAPSWWQKTVTTMLNLKKGGYIDAHALLGYGQRLRVLYDLCVLKPDLIYWGLKELKILDELPEHIPSDAPRQFRKLIEEIEVEW